MTPGATLRRLDQPATGKLYPALTHDADKLIRQLSLVAYLMVEQRPITARDVKSNVEGYSAMGDEAFARRFFADRTELKGLGVPIGSNRDEFTGEELYNLNEEQYFLPPVDLSDDELAALQTSLHLLEGQFAYSEPLRLALQNLALGRAHPTLDPGPKTATVDLLGSLYSPEVAHRLAKLEQAISKQRTVRFTYWTIGSDVEKARTINPYGLWELNGVGTSSVTTSTAKPMTPTAGAHSESRGSAVRSSLPPGASATSGCPRTSASTPTATGRRGGWDARCAAKPPSPSPPDATFWVQRRFGMHGEFDELDDGVGSFHHPVLGHRRVVGVDPVAGRPSPGQDEPVELVKRVTADLRADRPRALRQADRCRRSTAEPPAAPAPSQPVSREPSPVPPERFALLQALLAFLLASCGDDARRPGALGGGA